MSLDEAQEIAKLYFRDFSAGWFPGKEHNEIPGALGTEQPVGAVAAEHVIWSEGALRKFPGHSKIQTTAINSGATVQGMIDFTSQSNKLVGVVGDKIYDDLTQVTPTDITGGLTVSSTLQVDFQEYVLGSTKIVIGTNGTDAPFKWTGSGNASALGGSPPSGKWIEYFNNYIFLSNTSSNAERAYFSGLSDPETWDTTNDFFTFDNEITGMKTFGRQLVVFKRDSIGIISGFGRASWQKVDQHVRGVGCAAGHSIVNARLGGDINRDVLVFLADDGIYAFDGTPNVLKLSHPIQRKFVATASADRWNANRYPNAWATYSEKWEWYVLHLTDGGGTENDFRVILDLSRPFSTPDRKFAVPHWPSSSINGNCVVTRKVSGEDEIYFGGTDGFVRQISFGSFNEDDDSYSSYFQSKIFDARTHWVIREINPLIQELGNVNINIYLNADLEEGDGSSDAVSAQDTADVLDSTFIIGNSTLGGKDFLHKNAAINSEGRFLQFKFEQNIKDQNMVIEGLDIFLKNRGMLPNA